MLDHDTSTGRISGTIETHQDLEEIKTLLGPMARWMDQEDGHLVVTNYVTAGIYCWSDTDGYAPRHFSESDMFVSTIGVGDYVSFRPADTRVPRSAT